MKKITAFVLALIMCLALFAACGEEKKTGSNTPDTPSTPDIPETPEGPELSRLIYTGEIMPDYVIPEEGITVDGEYYSPEALAMIAVGDAYVNRNEWIQYDDTRLVPSTVSSDPIYRWANGHQPQDPENSSSQYTLYTNCAAFIHTLYMEAFGFDLVSYTTNSFISRKEMTVFEHTVRGDETDVERQKICNTVWETLVPGDLIVYRYNDESNGHIMAYVGGDKLVHSTAPDGGNYNYSTPKENAEPNGSICYMDVTDLFREDMPRYLFKLGRFSVLRPLETYKNQIKITKETEDRMKYMSGVVATLLSTAPYGISVNSGDEITYTIEIKNTNEKDVKVFADVTLDKNAEYLSGGNLVNGKISWETTVPANDTLKLTYTVKASSANGTKVGCGTVEVNGIQLKCPDITVKNTLTEDDQQLIDTAARAMSGSKSGELFLASEIYKKALGKELDLKDEKALFNSVFKTNEYSMTSLEILSSAKNAGAVIDAVYGGRNVLNSNMLARRTSVVRPEMLMPGDILIASDSVTGDKCSAYIMLLGGEMLLIDDVNGAGIIGAEETEDILMKILAKSAFAAIRPSFVLAK